jgi:hypothetical protein
MQHRSIQGVMDRLGGRPMTSVLGVLTDGDAAAPEYLRSGR